MSTTGRRSFGVNIGKIVTRVTKPVMRKRGFYDVDIISDWPFIVGEKWARYSLPHKLSFDPKSRRSGVLHIRVSPGANVLIKHIEPEIIDRVNTYFGFSAVKNLKIIHGDVAIHDIPPKKKEVKSDEEVPLPEIPDIENDHLKRALQLYQQAVIINKKEKS